MNETFIDLAVIERLIRRRSVSLVVLAVLGAALGAALSLVLSPGYVSTCEVLLQDTRSPNELPGETQIATSLVVLNHVADDLNWGVAGNDLQRQVSAVIADGNVLVVSGAAATPQAAQQLADKVTTEYANFSTQIAANASTANTQKARQAIQQKIDDANKQITQIQTSPAITAQGANGDQARAALQKQQVIVSDATKQIEQIDSAADSASLSASLSGANARIIQLATLPTGHSAPTPVQLVLGGAVGLALLGVPGYLFALRTDKRLRRAQDLARAFGAPVLGLVSAKDVVDQKAADDQTADEQAAAASAPDVEVSETDTSEADSTTPTDSAEPGVEVPEQSTSEPFATEDRDASPRTDSSVSMVRRPRVRPRLALADHPTDKFRPVVPGTSANHVEVT